MWEQDVLMRQIQGMAAMLAKILFGRGSPLYELPAPEVYTDADRLHIRLMELLEEGEINQAEDLLFADADPGDWASLEVGLDFYSRLNAKEDTWLEAHDFSREELQEGLEAFVGRFPIRFPDAGGDV